MELVILYSSDGPHKNAFDALQAQIEFHFGEINKLRHVQNTHAPISRLPAELLSEIFRCVVTSAVQNSNADSGVRRWTGNGDLCFGTGTFGFRQVCKHWNEVAIGSPQLWVWWVPGATEAWPLFYQRSGGAPISLFWRYSRDLARYPDVPKDAALPKRIRLLDFRGENQHFEHLLSAFDSIPPPNASSIRLKITPYHAKNPEDHLVRFFSLSFPKLSSLDIANFLPAPSSPVFMTSNLTSLKLSFPFSDKPHYTLATFSKTLQRHPNLQELDLEDGAMPRVEPSGAPVACVLSQLTVLKLCGTEGCVSELINLIGMSPPLLNVVLRFHYPRRQTVPSLVGPVKKILGAYYGRTEPDRPRRLAHLVVKEKEGQAQAPLVFIAKSSNSRSTHAPSPQSILRLELWGTQKVLEFFNLFPTKNVKTFSADGLSLSSKNYRTMLQKMKNLMHLSLASVYIEEVLEAIDFGNQGTLEINTKTRGQMTSTHADNPGQPVAPKLASLTLSRLILIYGVHKLLSYLRERKDREVGLKRLVVRACRVHSAEDLSGFKEVVKEIEWSDLEEGSESEADPEGFDSTDEQRDF